MLYVCFSGAYAACADSVLTTSARHDGELDVQGSRVRVGTAAVNWDDVLSITTSHRLRHTSPNVLTLKNGERWAGTVYGIRKNQLGFRLEQGGERAVDLQLVSAVDFYAGRTAQGGRKKGRLYRKDGTSIKGKLIDISPYGVRISSAIGVFNIPRAEVLRYVFQEPEESAATHDELFHVNGSVYFGTLKPSTDGFELDHPILESVRFSPDIIRALRRRTPRWQWLHDSTWSAVAGTSPAGTPTPPHLVDRDASPYQLRPPDWVGAIHVEADSTVRVGTPVERPGTFMALGTMPHGPTGATLTRIKEGTEHDRLQFEEADTGTPWTFAVKPGTAIEIRFSFGDETALPCSVLIGDPVVVFK